MATANIGDRIHELPIPLNKHPEEHGGWRIEIDFLEKVKGAATEIAARDDWDFGASEEEIEFIVLALLFLGKNEEVCESGSNVNVFSEIIERHMRDPNTSIVHWTRYDGTPETLTENGMAFLVIQSGIIMRQSYSRLRAEDEDLRIHGDVFEICRDLKTGDLWAYFPKPPEATQ